MLDGTATDFDLSILVTHTPPDGAGDLIDKSGYQKLFQNGEHVGDDKLTEMLRGLAAAAPPTPLVTCTPSRRTTSRRREVALFAMRRRPGTLFANVAAERQLPVISALRLQRLANDLAQKVKVTAAKMQRVLGGGGGGSDEKLEEDSGSSVSRTTRRRRLRRRGRSATPLRSRSCGPDGGRADA